MINRPSRYFQTGAFIKEFFRALGPHIKSCHAKDTRLGETLTVHLDECIPGQGTLDYAVYLDSLNALKDKDVCLMTEHLANEKDYDTAAAAIREVARKQGIAI
jgi:sugar phosphate isomerase/epimerase